MGVLTNGRYIHIDGYCILHRTCDWIARGKHVAMNPKNILIRVDPPTEKQSIGSEIDALGWLIMLGEAAVARDSDDGGMKVSLDHLHNRSEELKSRYEEIK